MGTFGTWDWKSWTPRFPWTPLPNSYASFLLEDSSSLCLDTSTALTLQDDACSPQDLHSLVASRLITRFKYAPGGNIFLHLEKELLTRKITDLPNMYARNRENMPEHGAGLGMVLRNTEGWIRKNIYYKGALSHHSNLTTQQGHLEPVLIKLLGWFVEN